MASKTLSRLSSPVARSCLIALGVCLVVDALLTYFAAYQYPYLIASVDELYIPDSQSITVVYSAAASAALLLSISTAIATFNTESNYVLIHACITAVFLPISILVYFTSLSSRYKVSDYIDDYKEMMREYRMKGHKSTNVAEHSQAPHAHIGPDNHDTTQSLASGKQLKLNAFINLIDTIQAKFVCCGVETHHDWTQHWDNFIPPSCCSKATLSKNKQWAALFGTEENHEFSHCAENDTYQLSCLSAMKENEQAKYAWLADLIVFLMVITIANTIVSLLLYGLKRTENMQDDEPDHELAMVGVSSKPRPSQPEITSIRHRPSVVQTLGAAPDRDHISAISQVVQMNIVNRSPRPSIGGASKFSAGARRKSSVGT